MAVVIGYWLLVIGEGLSFIVGISSLFTLHSYLLPLHPLTVLFDNFDKAVESLFLRDVALDALFAFVEAHFSHGCAHITVVGVCHFARTINDTAHNADF